MNLTALNILFPPFLSYFSLLDVFMNIFKFSKDRRCILRVALYGGCELLLPRFFEGVCFFGFVFEKGKEISEMKLQTEKDFGP